MDILPLPTEIIDTPEFRIRFWNKICRIGKSDEECWLWNGALNDNNSKYSKTPRVKIHNINYYASRVVYYLHYGIDPEDLLVCHNCSPNKDNPICLNPRHLWLGTAGENQEDSIEKVEFILDLEDIIKKS